MINSTISEIEERIRHGATLSAGQKRELLELLGLLKSEVAELSKTHGAQAGAIAGLARTSAEVATREPNPERLERTLGELSAAVGEFETSHPKLVQVVNRIATTLSNLGI
jgi:Mg2+ and Co2+ transporter CorA